MLCLEGTVDVISRSEWGGIPVQLSKMPVPQRDVFIHHTADYGPPEFTVEAESRYLRRIERFHTNNRGFIAIAYSFIVMPSGRAYEGRGWGKGGAHTRGHNRSAHAICVAGHYDKDRPTGQSLNTVGALINLGVHNGSISKGYLVRGHREVGNTSCPGDHLFDQLDRIEEAARAAGEPPPEGDMPILEFWKLEDDPTVWQVVNYHTKRPVHSQDELKALRFAMALRGYPESDRKVKVVPDWLLDGPAEV